MPIKHTSLPPTDFRPAVDWADDELGLHYVTHDGSLAALGLFHGETYVVVYGPESNLSRTVDLKQAPELRKLNPDETFTVSAPE